MGLFSKPKPPDPTATADAQYGYSKQAAEDTAKMGAAAGNRSGPFGSTTTQVDANGMPIGQSATLSGALQGAADTGQAAVGAQMGLLPTAPINWDETTAPKIAQQNYDAYTAMTAPQRDQQWKQIEGTMSDRGIPVGSEIWDDQAGNFDRGGAIADKNAAATAWNAAPGMQTQITNNEIAQNDQPANTTAKSLGLLGGINSLSPGYAPLPTASTSAPDYSTLAQQNYQQQMQQYNNMWGGIGSLAKTGAGLAFA